MRGKMVKKNGTEGGGSVEYFTRKEAAEYLTSIGCPTAPQTLANLASNGNAGGGPPFITSGWRTLRYARTELDAWAKRRIKRTL